MADEWDEWFSKRRKKDLFGQHELPGRVRMITEEGTDPDHSHHLGFSRHKLTRLLHVQREHRNTLSKKTLILADGTSIALKEREGNTRIDIVSPVTHPVGKKEVQKPIELETESSRWVMLLSIVTLDGTLLGILMVSQSFHVMRFFENDGDPKFDGFENRDTYWGRMKDPSIKDGFWERWGNQEHGVFDNDLDEMRRRTEMDLLSSDGVTVAATSEDSGWIPGKTSVPWYDQAGYLATGTVWGDEWVGDSVGPPSALYPEFPDAPPPQDQYFWGYTWVYPRDEFAATGDNAFGVSYTDGYFNIAAYVNLAPDYQVSGLSWFNPPYVAQACSDFQLIQYWAQRVKQPFHTDFPVYPIWEPAGPMEIVSSVHVDDAYAYPSDGKQRRSYTAYSQGDYWYYFEKDGAVSSHVVETSIWARNTRNHWVEGVWSGTQETTDTTDIGDTLEPEQNTSTLPSPLNCLPQEIWPRFRRWAISVTHLQAMSDTVTYSPCWYAGYWGEIGRTPPYPDVGEPPFLGELWFDDGHVEVMGSGSTASGDDTNGRPYALDLAIYSWPVGENPADPHPIYVGHYHYPGAEHENCLFYYYKGKFRASSKFSNPADNLTRIDAFNSLAKYGGYWNGQVRVGKLTTQSTMEVRP